MRVVRGGVGAVGRDGQPRDEPYLRNTVGSGRCARIKRRAASIEAFSANARFVNVSQEDKYVVKALYANAFRNFLAASSVKFARIAEVFQDITTMNGGKVSDLRV